MKSKSKTEKSKISINNIQNKEKNPILKLLGEMISFGSPRGIFINITIIFLLLIIIPVSSIGYSPFKCIITNVILPTAYKITGNEFFTKHLCIGCGMTRAMSNLMHGNIKTAFEFNKLVFPVFGMMLFLWLTNLQKIIRNYKDKI